MLLYLATQLCGANCSEKPFGPTWLQPVFRVRPRFTPVIFIVSAVLVLHLSGALSGFLTGLNTLTGLALFAALWATTIWSTGRAIPGVGGQVLATRTPTGSVVRRAARSGPLNGGVFRNGDRLGSTDADMLAKKLDDRFVVRSRFYLRGN